MVKYNKTALNSFVFASLFLSQILFSSGEAETAKTSQPIDKKTELEQALESIDPRHKEASQAMLKRRWSKAKKLYREILAENPDDAEAYLNIGACSLQLAQFREATDHLVNALAYKPHLAYAWSLLGFAYFQLEELDLAVSALARAIHENPKDPQAHHYLGLAAKAKGWQIAAEKEISKALKIDPKFAEAHFNLAIIYLDRTPPSIELARRHYKLALKHGAAPDQIMEEKLR